MSRGLTLLTLACTLGVLSLLACAGPYQGASVPGPAGPTSATPNVLTATCKEYDVGARTMDVITGVSFSLREITFHIHENTEITIRDERAELTDMRAGMVVRIEYRVTPQGNLADKIEVVLDATGMR
jgi:hypothetical protein